MRFLAFLLLCGVSSLQAEKPFDFAATPGKLPKTIRPTDYAIRLEPDLEKLTFTGDETVQLQVTAPVREIVCNVLEVSITEARIDGQILPASSIRIEEDQQLAHFALPQELGPGAHTLALKFTGKINAFGAGLFYARYQEKASGTRKLLLGTQFEATDARRMFPSWDEPSFRARFQLTVLVPDNWMAISNMPIAREKKLDGKREVEFQPTPAMASYLNVFCAGEFEAIEGEAEGVKLRVITTKGKGEMGRYALESTAQILRYYNDYFGLAYPLPKLDQLALPGGFGGAMENWGGITYFETALLFDPVNSASTTKQRVFEVIAHEVAHQWFGDLVTMAWWDNLWLNEGFASWMGTKCTAHFNPTWEVWLERNAPRDPARRTGAAKEQAMAGDARRTTHAIQQPIATEAEANGAFDDITYKKGQSFLRMLESFVGEEAFRGGLRRYMQAHKFSNATTADLWGALDEVSGKPVAEVATAWTQQPGFPLVNVTRGPDDVVLLSQRRFTVNYRDSNPSLWKIPLSYRIAGKDASADLLLSDETAMIRDVPSDHALKLNLDGIGNYRTAYDDTSWKLLLGALPHLSTPDKVNLLSDAWALVEAGLQAWPFYSDLITRLPASTDLAERDQIINTFDYVQHLLTGSPALPQFEAYAIKVLRPTLRAIGLTPHASAAGAVRGGEPPTISTLRASLILQLGLSGDKEVIEACRHNFELFLQKPSNLSPDLRAPTFAVLMRYGNAETWDRLHKLGLETTSAEEKQNFYFALAYARDPELIARTLAVALSDELPTSRATYLVTQTARDSGRADLVWEFAQKNKDALSGKLDALGAINYFPALCIFFTDSDRAQQLQEFAQKNLGKESRKSVELATDEILFRSDLKKRLEEALPSHG
ncbi:MAG: M1 family metallopeptidase [Verrucomicrobiota bacterium]